MVEDRFKSKYTISESGCWLWTACQRGNGYGCMKYNGKLIDAHRLSYMFNIGEIPLGMYVCHKCDNRLCVNPNHLFLGTAKDNYDDAVRKGRIHVPTASDYTRKHPNMSSYRYGCRCDECKEIQRIREAKYRMKKKGLALNDK
jgi:hypothetical protein